MVSDTEHYHAIAARLARNIARRDNALHEVARLFYARQVENDEKELASEEVFLKARDLWEDQPSIAELYEALK